MAKTGHICYLPKWCHYRTSRDGIKYIDIFTAK